MGLPKLVLIAILFVVVWSAARWLRRVQHELPRRRPARRPALEAEELTACRVCGAYVLDSAAGCGRPDCPRLH